MRVSAKAEYACVAVLELAARSQGPAPVHIKTIHDATGIPFRFLVQILLQLKTAGLVTSTRGKAGGYHLSRPAEEISLADVISCIDERSALPASRLHKVLRTPAIDVLLGAWREVEEEKQRLLERLTLAELMVRAQKRDALTYHI
jgi:Rrf2 family protein